MPGQILRLLPPMERLALVTRSTSETDSEIIDQPIAPPPISLSTVPLATGSAAGYRFSNPNLFR
ncbi:MAG TPA: hypothetical protein VGJ05_07655, partial [Fimbriiglobus sp.]